MVSSGGGGSPSAPNQPAPSGPTTGYGMATPFNPQQHSVLSNGMGWADVNEIDAASAANAQARAAAPPPGAMGNMPPMDPAMLRQMLSQIMNPPLTPQQQALMRRNSQYGTQGTYAGYGGSMSSGGQQGGGNNRGGYSSSRS